MNLRPLQDRLIVRPAEKEEKTKGGILLPGQSQERPVTGEVLAVGPGRYDDAGRLVPIGVLVGETVLFGKYGGQEITVEGEEVLVVRESDIFAVIAAPEPTPEAVPEAVTEAV